MDKKEAETQQITIYWWNLGTKTLDFEGSYKDYLLKRGITVEDIKHPTTQLPGWRFTIAIGSITAVLDIYGPDYAQACDDVIKVFLTLMGDKAKFVPHRRDARLSSFYLNWR
jgi:hypothetical protein